MRMKICIAYRLKHRNINVYLFMYIIHVVCFATFYILAAVAVAVIGADVFIV